MAPQELQFAQEKGTRVVDVRPPADFEAEHIQGSVSVPLFRPITGPAL